MHFEISPFDLMKTTLRPRQRKGAKPAVAAVAFSSVDANDEHKKAMKELNCHFISDEKGGLSQITHLIAAVDPSSPIHPTR
ncbi:hypothetical protein ACHAXM_001489, partial [Skeletonema potamos]